MGRLLFNLLHVVQADPPTKQPSRVAVSFVMRLPLMCCTMLKKFTVRIAWIAQNPARSSCRYTGIHPMSDIGVPGQMHSAVMGD